MTNLHTALNSENFAPLSDSSLDAVNGGMLPFITLGIAIGIGYCIWDGTLGPKPGPKGDFPTGPKNMG